MSTPATELPRRQLTGRRPEMVTRLLDAAVAEVAASGFEALTVRKVAKAAGVSAATAYSYFASKEHLLAEVWWRRLAALPAPDFSPRDSLGTRVEKAVAPVALVVADEPELAAAVTTALLAHDPDVGALRQQSGDLMAERLGLALGDAIPEPARLGLTMMLLGGLIASGMQAMDYRAVPALLGQFTDLLEPRRGKGRR